MTNLLQETIDILSRNGKSTDMVLWVGSYTGEYAMSWRGFASIANVKYRAGYGIEEIAVDLVVVGADWWLERHEYDGSEWWEYKTLPVITKGYTFLSVVGHGQTLEIINS